MKTKLTLLATLSILSCASHAADTAFYQITEIAGNKAGNYGPWPVAMTEDKSVASLAVTSDWFSSIPCLRRNGLYISNPFRYIRFSSKLPPRTL